jgi:hypothetical protein
MPRLVGLLTSWVLIAVVALATGQPAASPFVGTWKITVLPRGAELTLWLIRISEKDAKLDATLLSAGQPEFKNTKIKSVQADGRALRLTLDANEVPYEVVGYLPQGEAQPKMLLGSIGALGRRDLARLERTTDKELTTESSQVLGGPAAEAFERAFTTADAKERETAFKDILQKFAGQPMAFHAAMQLVQHAADHAGSDADVRKQGDELLKLASPYGREMELQALAQIAQHLARSDKHASLAVEYARKAEQLLTANDAPVTQVRILKALAAGLAKAGKASDARDAEARLAKVNELVDQEYLKTAIPFKPEKFAGRQSNSQRVLLLELFTGTQCPPCVAADIAFDALAQSYTPKEVVLLEYHLHIPGPDPLTNLDSEKRAAYYLVEGTPFLFINGQDGPAVFGFRQHAKDRYQTLRRTLDARLEGEPGANLKLAASRQGSLVDIQADYADLKRSGDDIKLRLALVEEAVRYAAPNGQRFHRHVVRSFPGGVAGVPLKMKSGKHAVSVDVEQVRGSLNRYLTEFAKVGRFPDDDKPLDLKRLKVVAFIQDDKNKEVFQAAQADLPESGSK